MKKLNKLGIIAICVIILSALTTTATFSWLARPDATPVEGKSMKLVDATAVVKDDAVTATTYLATLENGVLKKGDKVKTSTQFTIDAGEAQYFRTEVVNSGDAVNNIMLGGLKLSSSGTNTYVNCLSPLKTSVLYDSNGTAITQHLTVKNGTTLYVDWYIYNGSSTTALNKITISTLPSVQFYN